MLVSLVCLALAADSTSSFFLSLQEQKGELMDREHHQTQLDSVSETNDKGFLGPRRAHSVQLTQDTDREDKGFLTAGSRQPGVIESETQVIVFGGERASIFTPYSTQCFVCANSDRTVVSYFQESSESAIRKHSASPTPKAF